VFFCYKTNSNVSPLNQAIIECSTMGPASSSNLISWDLFVFLQPFNIQLSDDEKILNSLQNQLNSFRKLKHLPIPPEHREFSQDGSEFKTDSLSSAGVSIDLERFQIVDKINSAPSISSVLSDSTLLSRALSRLANRD